MPAMAYGYVDKASPLFHGAPEVLSENMWDMEMYNVIGATPPAAISGARFLQNQDVCLRSAQAILSPPLTLKGDISLP